MSSESQKVLLIFPFFKVLLIFGVEDAVVSLGLMGKI